MEVRGTAGNGIGRRRALRAGAVIGVGLLAARAGDAAEDVPTKFDRTDVDKIVKDWPGEAKAAAAEMLGKYGPPQEATPTRLIWHANGPWKRTIVHQEAVEHAFPTKHMDVLEQVVEYKMPLNFFNALAVFDGSVVADRTRGELAAHCDKETTNLVALNLAHEIARGQKSAEQARDAFAAAMHELQSGRTPDIAKGLRLGAPQGDLRDPDTPVVPPAGASGSSRP